MNKLFIIVSILTTFSCKVKESKSIVDPDPGKQQVTSADTVRKKKIAFPIEFENYKAHKFSGKRANINYASNKTARNFRSAIKWSIGKSGVNFAGHYNIARWGCGTNCINGAITDLETGHVYDLPSATLDYEFMNDSRYL